MDNSLLMGMGLALGERYPVAEGVGQATNFDRYRLCRAHQAPRLEALIIENPDPRATWGVRGMGEMPFIPLAPALVAAIHDATGVWFDQLPLTPERVWQGLTARP